MIFIIISGSVLAVAGTLVLYCSLVVSADADRRIEKYFSDLRKGK